MYIGNSTKQDFGESFLQDVCDWVGRTFNPNDIFDNDELTKWVEDTYDPEDIFSENELKDWANRNGWVKE